LLIVRLVSSETSPAGEVDQIVRDMPVVALFHVALPMLTVPPPSPLFARVSTMPALIELALFAEVNELLFAKLACCAALHEPASACDRAALNVSVALLLIVVLFGVTPPA
jgi:hypothetical protein